MTYPEIDIQVAGAAEFTIADLERDRHFVILAQVLVEALEIVRGQGNVVGGGDIEGDGRGEERPRYRDDLHRCGCMYVVIIRRRRIY